MKTPINPDATQKLTELANIVREYQVIEKVQNVLDERSPDVDLMVITQERYEELLDYEAMYKGLQK